MRAPIVSRKHIIQHPEFNVVTATVLTHTEVESVAIQNVNAAHEVVEGSVVKAIFVELWLLCASSLAEGSFVLIVEKSQAGQGNPSFATMTTLDAYVNKKNILFTSQGLVAEGGVGNPTPVLRQWIKIPKGKQRFGINDKIRIHIAALGSLDISGCGMTIYKSYQ